MKRFTVTCWKQDAAGPHEPILLNEASRTFCRTHQEDAMIMSFPGAVHGKSSSFSGKQPIVGPESFGPLAWPTWHDFSQLAQAYAQELFGFPIDVRLSEMQCLQDLLCYAYVRQNLPRGARILDAGNGWSRVLASLAADYECWSIAPFFDRQGNATPLPSGYGYKTVVGSMQDSEAPLPTSYFDFVFSNITLCHAAGKCTPDIQEFLKNIGRVTKSGAFCLLCVDYVRHNRSESTRQLEEFYAAATGLLDIISPPASLEPASSTRLYTMPEKTYKRWRFPATQQVMTEYGELLTHCLLLHKSGQSQTVGQASFFLQDIPNIYVVTSCNNSEKDINETISSIVDQRGSFYLHYHILDRGSADNTPTILANWERQISEGQYPVGAAGVFFSWATLSDNGFYNAIGNALSSQAIPDAAFMGWINAGDILMPGVLAEVTSLTYACPDVKWVLGQSLRARTGGALHYDVKTRYPREVVAAGLCDGQHWAALPPGGGFWRAALWHRSGGFDPRLPHAADWDLWRRFADSAAPYQLLAPLGIFRQQPHDVVEKSRKEACNLLPEQERRLRLEAIQKAEHLTVRCIEPSPTGELRNLITRQNRNTAGPGKDFFADMYGNREALRVLCRQRSRELAGRERHGSPLFSVVTPSFNQARFIEDTIMGVLLQGEDNFEHIIMDGGSTDGTVELLAEYPHLQWTSEKDRGQTHALNKALERARGDIVAWINSDDYYTPKAFAAIVNAFSNPGVSMVLGGCLWIYEGTDCSRLVPGRDIGFQEMIRYWNDLTPPPQPALFFRRSLLDEIGYFDENLNLTMDYDFWLRATAHGERIIGIDDLLAIYRFHGGSKSGDQDDWRKFYAEWHQCYQQYRSFAFELPPSPLLTVAIPWGVPSFNQENKVKNFLERVTGDKFRDMEVVVVADTKHPVPDSLLRDIPVEVKILYAGDISPEIFLRNSLGAARGAIIWFPSLNETLENKWFMRPLNLLLDDSSMSSVDLYINNDIINHSFLPGKSKITCQRFYRLI